MLQKLCAALAVVLLSSTTATAQQFPMPQPFEHPGAPCSQPTCTKEYVAFLGVQKKFITEMRDSVPQQLQAVCTSIEWAEQFAKDAARMLKQDEGAFLEKFEDFVGEATRNLRRQFGVPRVDVRWLKHVCRHTAGETAREMTNQLGHILAEETRCAGT